MPESSYSSITLLKAFISPFKRQSYTLVLSSSILLKICIWDNLSIIASTLHTLVYFYHNKKCYNHKINFKNYFSIISPFINKKKWHLTPPLLFISNYEILFSSTFLFWSLSKLNSCHIF